MIGLFGWQESGAMSRGIDSCLLWHGISSGMGLGDSTRFGRIGLGAVDGQGWLRGCEIR